MHYVDLLAVSYYRERRYVFWRMRALRSGCMALAGMLDWINGSNVDYRGRVSAYDIPALMADSRIVLSTMTWFKDGTHDESLMECFRGR